MPIFLFTCEQSKPNNSFAVSQKIKRLNLAKVTEENLKISNHQNFTRLTNLDEKGN